jgi:hypothetical protein
MEMEGLFFVVALALIVLKDTPWGGRAIPSFCAWSSWRNPAPADVFFRLASLAALSLTLYWFPVYYWTTYHSDGDDRGGYALFPALVFSPVSTVLAAVLYFQGWRRRPHLAGRKKWLFPAACTVLFLVALSPSFFLWRALFVVLRFLAVR